MLQQTFPSHGSNPFKEPYNFDFDYGPQARLNKPEYNNLLPLSHNEMENDNTYATIEDLLNLTFSSRHIDTRLDIHRQGEHSTVGQYLYSPNLANYLYLVLNSTDTNISNTSSSNSAEESKEAVEELTEIELQNSFIHSSSERYTICSVFTYQL